MNNNFPLKKIIYQTYECEYSELHDVWKQTSKLWIDKYPNWEYNFSSSEKRRNEIISILNPSSWALKAYDNFKGVIQADVWKYVILAKDGGMYADLDSTPSKMNIDDLIDSLNKPKQVITSPKNYQCHDCIQCSNFIFAKNTDLGKKIKNLMHEYLEIGGFLLKNNRPPIQEMPIKVWFDFIELNIDNVEDILLPFTPDRGAIAGYPGYYIHGETMKPPKDWRNRFEIGPKKRTQYYQNEQTLQPKTYSQEWKMLKNAAIENTPWQEFVKLSLDIT